MPAATTASISSGASPVSHPVLLALRAARSGRRSFLSRVPLQFSAVLWPLSGCYGGVKPPDLQQLRFRGKGAILSRLCRFGIPVHPAHLHCLPRQVLGEPTVRVAIAVAEPPSPLQVTE